jgi:hypothetical protein
MSATMWPLIELSARLLEAGEREVVLGDLQETRVSTCRGLLEVFGLALRRQASLWGSPQPWLAGFLIALPAGFLLMAASFSISLTWERLVYHKVFEHGMPTGHEGFAMWGCQVLLVAAWSWSAGHTVGSISPRTLWASCVLAAVPFLFFFCWPFYRLYFFLFLPPAIGGASLAWRRFRLQLYPALFMALAVTVLMISAWANDALWVANWALLLPIWHVVLNSWRSSSHSLSAIS